MTRYAMRMARWSATNPWKAIATWFVLVAVCLTTGLLIGPRSTVDADFWTGGSGRAQQIAAQGDLTDPLTENVLITARNGPLDPAAADAAARSVTTRMRALTAVGAVAPPVRAPDGSAVLVVVTMLDDTAHIDALLAATAATQDEHPTLLVEQTGGATIDNAIAVQVRDDLLLAEALTVPVTLLILLIAFGVVIAAGVSLVLATSSVLAAIGLAAVASQVFPDVGMTTNIVLLMGMAVGVDYSLFYVTREREERARTGGTLDRVTSVELAAATSGHAVLVSGLAVIVSMASLYLGDIAVFSSLATGSVIVVAVAMIGSLTVLPALIVTLGRRMDSPRVPLLGRFTRPNDNPRVWRALLRPALRHPWLTFTGATLALVLLALPALNLRLTAAGLDTMPRAIGAMQTYDRLTTAFPSEGAAHLVSVRADAGTAARVTAALAAIVTDVRDNPLFVVPTGTTTRASADHRVHTISLGTPHTADSERAGDSLNRLTEIAAHRLHPIPGVTYAVGGDVAKHHDEIAVQAAKMPWVVGFVLLLTLLIMFGAFRSVLVAITAVGLNILSAAAALGVLVAVFQNEWAEDLLDFRSTGAVISWVPLFLFVVLFGLSMDYHVFLISRIREAAGQPGTSTRDAVAGGIISSAGVLTVAAVVMMSVFLTFVFTAMVELKQLGLTLAVAVLLDAVVIRILILPALMVLLGRANWWPAKPGRR
ncbi:MMPL family transporter [Actinoplanes sp. NPDC051494]|uniref:MMPL family transporter n=1 Tax=Actinoplanes sp. NPDC051494 TaxID=3363907 RepID=UPI0037AC7870